MMESLITKFKTSRKHLTNVEHLSFVIGTGTDKDLQIANDIMKSVSYNLHNLQLEKATKEHQDIKSGAVEKRHSFSLPYAKKKVNEMTKNLKTAQVLWGDNE